VLETAGLSESETVPETALSADDMGV
jgi:hypothetical protein